MAMHEVTSEVNELLAMGITADEIKAQFGAEISYPTDQGEWFINSRGTQARLNRWAHELKAQHRDEERAEDMAQGHLVEWRKVSGQWLLAGAGLTPGAVVTVTRRNGTESREIVGRIISEQDGITFATVGQA